MTEVAVGRKDGADTTPVTSPVATVAAPALLDRFRTAAHTYDANLDTVLAYLRELSTADEKSLVPSFVEDPATRSKMARVEVQMALHTLTHFLTSGISPAVRSAPPSGLAEILADSSRLCRAPRCGEYVQPWEHDGVHCDPECAAEAAAAFGIDAS